MNEKLSAAVESIQKRYGFQSRVFRGEVILQVPAQKLQEAGQSIIQYMMQSKLEQLTLFCSPFLEVMSTISSLLVHHLPIVKAYHRLPAHTRR